MGRCQGASHENGADTIVTGGFANSPPAAMSLVEAWRSLAMLVDADDAQSVFENARRNRAAQTLYDVLQRMSLDLRPGASTRQQDCASEAPTKTLDSLTPDEPYGVRTGDPDSDERVRALLRVALLHKFLDCVRPRARPEEDVKIDAESGDSALPSAPSLLISDQPENLEALAHGQALLWSTIVPRLSEDYQGYLLECRDIRQAVLNRLRARAPEARANAAGELIAMWERVLTLHATPTEVEALNGWFATASWREQYRATPLGHDQSKSEIEDRLPASRDVLVRKILNRTAQNHGRSTLR